MKNYNEKVVEALETVQKYCNNLKDYLTSKEFFEIEDYIPQALKELHEIEDHIAQMQEKFPEAEDLISKTSKELLETKNYLIEVYEYGSIMEEIGGSKNLTELVYDEYKQYEFMPKHKPQGISHKFMFDNGYGASVVKTKFTYGGDEDLFELAVIKKSDDDFDLCYDTPIADDVLGWLSNDDVLETLEKIKKYNGGKK